MKKNKYYPLFMDIRNLPCLVVGGGMVAERKVKGLFEAGARVVVVSPEVTAQIKKWHLQGMVRWTQRRYRAGHLKNMRLVIGATDNADTNKKIYCDAEKKGIPVNIVDAPVHCRFIVPAVLRHGPITIAISTGGAAPAVSAKIRKELEKSISSAYPVLVSALREQRGRIRVLSKDKKLKFWKKIAALPMKRFEKNKKGLLKKIEAFLKEAEK
jgi:siroheme synthase-like protein